MVLKKKESKPTEEEDVKVCPLRKPGDDGACEACSG